MPSLRSHVERVARHRYTFTSTWELPAPRDRTFGALADLWAYPTWWPEFKKAQQLSDDHGTFTLRSALPVTLTFTLTRDVQDERSGLLRANADGDIAGTVQWRVSDAGQGKTNADFQQDVILNHPTARRADLFLRPLLSWNHEVAMRSGARGLTLHLTDNAPES